MNKRFWKNLVSWIIAIIAAYIALRLIFAMISFTFAIVWGLTIMIIGTVLVLIIAIPIYMIIRKRFLN